MARACGAKVQPLAVVLVSCSLDGFASLPFVDTALPIVPYGSHEDEKEEELSLAKPVPSGCYVFDDEEEWAVYTKKRLEEHAALSLRRACGVVPYVIVRTTTTTNAAATPKHNPCCSSSSTSYSVDTNLLWPILHARQDALRLRSVNIAEVMCSAAEIETEVDPQCPD